jgi:hypothetical protein
MLLCPLPYVVLWCCRWHGASCQDEPAALAPLQGSTGLGGQGAAAAAACNNVQQQKQWRPHVLQHAVTAFIASCLIPPGRPAAQQRVVLAPSSTAAGQDMCSLMHVVASAVLSTLHNSSRSAHVQLHNAVVAALRHVESSSQRLAALCRHCARHVCHTIT